MVDNRFTASLLRASADGIAGIAASRLLEADPDFALDGFDAWRGHLRTQLGELAAAVEDETPELFAERVVWSRDAFLARSVPVAALTASVVRLREAVEESLPEEACAPLSEYFDRASMELARERATTVSEIDGPHAQITRDYVLALANGDSRAAVGVVMSAMDAGLGVRDVLDSVLGSAQREVGRLWHAGELSVSEEHFATTTSNRVLERAMVRAPEVSLKGGTVLLTSVAGDAHDIGVRLVAAFFELEGWRTICLGADTPTADLVQAAQHFDVDLVAIGATLGSQRESVAAAVRALKEARPLRPVIVGGSAFAHGDHLWQRVRADGYAASPSAAVELAKSLVPG